eukprot:3518060-Amphidinium_carterae.1
MLVQIPESTHNCIKLTRPAQSRPARQHHLAQVLCDINKALESISSELDFKDLHMYSSNSAYQ